jgi:hypothetical protein
VEGQTVEKLVDFSTGELAIRVTRNAELADAVIRIFSPGTSKQIDAGRTYKSGKSNPQVFRLTAGRYDVEIGSVEIAGKPSHRFEDVEVKPGGRAERAHDFPSGTLVLKASRSGALVDAVVRVRSAETGKAVTQRRSYESPKSNPVTFLLSPGRYEVEASAVRLEGRPSRRLDVTLAPGETLERTLEFGK